MALIYRVLSDDDDDENGQTVDTGHWYDHITYVG